MKKIVAIPLGIISLLVGTAAGGLLLSGYLNLLAPLTPFIPGLSILVGDPIILAVGIIVAAAGLITAMTLFVISGLSSEYTSFKNRPSEKGRGYALSDNALIILSHQALTNEERVVKEDGNTKGFALDQPIPVDQLSNLCKKEKNPDSLMGTIGNALQKGLDQQNIDLNKPVYVACLLDTAERLQKFRNEGLSEVRMWHPEKVSGDQELGGEKLKYKHPEAEHAEAWLKGLMPEPYPMSSGDVDSGNRIDGVRADTLVSDPAYQRVQSPDSPQYYQIHFFTGNTGDPNHIILKRSVGGLTHVSLGALTKFVSSSASEGKLVDAIKSFTNGCQREGHSLEHLSINIVNQNDRNSDQIKSDYSIRDVWLTPNEINSFYQNFPACSSDSPSPGR